MVVLRLRGYQDVGSTFIGVVERYAQKLQENGGKLLLCGVSEGVGERPERTETTETIPEEDIFLADDIVSSSTRRALAAAQQWLEQVAPDTSEEDVAAGAALDLLF